MKIQLLCINLILASCSHDNHSFEKWLDYNIDNILIRSNISGISVSEFKNGQTVLNINTGIADNTTKAPVTDNSIFSYSSAGRIFTTYAILKLAEEQKINLNDSFVKYTGTKLNKETTKQLSHLTVLDLILNNSNFPKIDYPGKLFSEKISPEQQALGYGKIAPALPTEKLKKSVYSSVNYIYLEIIIETVTNMKFEDYMDSTIIPDFNLRNTTFNIKKIKNRLVSPHNSKNKRLFENIAGATADHGIYSNAQDIASFLMQLLERSRNNDKICQMMFNTGPEASYPEAFMAENFGYGFMIDKNEDTPYFYHNVNQRTGWTNYLIIHPESKSGLTIAVNSDNAHKIIAGIAGRWTEHMKFRNPTLSHSYISLNTFLIFWACFFWAYASFLLIWIFSSSPDYKERKYNFSKNTKIAIIAVRTSIIASIILIWFIWMKPFFQRYFPDKTLITSIAISNWAIITLFRCFLRNSVIKKLKGN